MRLAFVSIFQAAALVAALPQQPPSPVPDTPLPPGAVPDSPATGPPIAPPAGSAGGTGPGGSNMVADSITMVGTGCPVGAGGVVQEVREGTPVFTFTEWNLALADASAPTEGAVASVEKFCQEIWKLSSGPTGMQYRIGTVTIEGWADLKTGSKIDIAVETRLGDAPAGVCIDFISLLIGWSVTYHGWKEWHCDYQSSEPQRRRSEGGFRHGTTDLVVLRRQGWHSSHNLYQDHHHSPW